jgi:hypothetical protein
MSHFGRSSGHLVVDSHNVDEDLDPDQHQSKKLDPIQIHIEMKSRFGSASSEKQGPHKNSLTLKNGKNKYDILQRSP